ncbi:MAG TPA: hypothetical protein VLC50_02605, partial [Actinomycetes bacterium]|nr:hypothetical protein [Actinomycetes bacterium]
LVIPEPSKAEALRVGDRAARGFPRLYVDADVELSWRDVRVLAAALDEAGVLASAPERIIPMTEVSWAVRAYYAVWQELPRVRSGLFGRGVIAVSEAGHRRIATLPDCLSDDLVLSEAFAADERTLDTGASVVVHPPRTWADLIRRRIRAMTGNEQARSLGLASYAARTTSADLRGLAVRRPALLPKIAVFLAATIAARRGARAARRRGDYTSWLRDESSRRVEPPSGERGSLLNRVKGTPARDSASGPARAPR